METGPVRSVQASANTQNVQSPIGQLCSDALPQSEMGKASPKKPCPHCHKLYTERTIRDHLKRFRKDAGTDGLSLNLVEGMRSDEQGRGTAPVSIGAVNNCPGGSHTMGESSRTDPTPLVAPGFPLAMDPPHPPPQNPLASPADSRESSPATLRRNPPVTVEDWPEPEEDTSDTEHDGMQIPPEDAHRAPDDLYACEHNPDDDSEASQQYSELSDPDFLDLLTRELGDLSDEEIQSIYKQTTDSEDVRTIKMLAAKLRSHFSKQTYDDLRWSFSEEINIPSEYVAWRRIQALSRLNSRLYECCVNSCCLFLGKHKDLVNCSYCKEPRYNKNHRPRKYFRYIPLIPQLQALYQSLSMIDKLKYRPNFVHESGIVRDIFDGIHYRLLCRKQLSPDNPYRYFGNACDIALGFSLDGFTLFKRRRKGNSTAWPLILVNYNLPPEIRTHLENIICIGVIPGPKQFKDLNSFLIPLLEELLELKTGVETIDCSAPEGQQKFLLRAFIIIAFGDIPALSKLLGVKGHNAMCPCRACDIIGVKDSKPGSHVYYVPMTRPDGELSVDPSKLPMRTAESFDERLDQMEATPTKTARENLARSFGINSRCLFSTLQTIDVATCFPYDFMHLIYENLVPNLIRHWTGTFKDLDQGRGNYELSSAQWEAIGRETAAATQTLPGGFVGTIPDIAQDHSLYKAESHSFWIQYIAPIVLKGRLPDKYYFHLLDLRDIIELSLRYEISNAEISTLEQMIIRWVSDYEVYYYQRDASRLSACPLTIHALLHIPFYIRQTGPVWVSWAFVMERFCGSLLPAVKNRLNPYPCIDNYVLRRAQMQVISLLYGIRTIQAPNHSRDPNTGEAQVRTSAKGVPISAWEHVYDEFPASILGRPVRESFPIDTQLSNQLARYLGLLFNPSRSPSQIKALIIPESVVRYGRVRIAGDGDRIRTAEGNHSQRNNSFVRYIMFPDANARFRNREDQPIRQVNYGRLEDIFYVELKEHGDPNVNRKLLLARITPCELHRHEDATESLVEYTKMSTAPIIVHLNSVEAAVGRVKRHTTWGIIDRSRGGVRTLFTNDHNAPGEHERS